MANEKKNIKDKKPKFSPYWIYGIIITIFLGTSLFSNSGFQEGKETFSICKSILADECEITMFNT